MAPRDRDKIEPLTPAQLDEKRQQYTREAALYENPNQTSGFRLTIKPLAATLDKNERGDDEIHLTVVVDGVVTRPGVVARATHKTVVVKIPAKLNVEEA